MTSAELTATIARLTAERDALDAKIAALRQQLAPLRTAEWLAADRAARPCGEGEREEVDGNERRIWTMERVTPIRRVIRVREEIRRRRADGGTYAWTQRPILTRTDLRYAHVARLFGLTP